MNRLLRSFIVLSLFLLNSPAFCADLQETPDFSLKRKVRSFFSSVYKTFFHEPSEGELQFQRLSDARKNALESYGKESTHYLRETAKLGLHLKRDRKYSEAAACFEGIQSLTKGKDGAKEQMYKNALLQLSDIYYFLEESDLCIESLTEMLRLQDSHTPVDVNAVAETLEMLCGTKMAFHLPESAEHDSYRSRIETIRKRDKQRTEDLLKQGYRMISIHLLTPDDYLSALIKKNLWGLNELILYSLLDKELKSSEQSHGRIAVYYERIAESQYLRGKMKLPQEYMKKVIGLRLQNHSEYTIGTHHALTTYVRKERRAIDKSQGTITKDELRNFVADCVKKASEKYKEGLSLVPLLAFQKETEVWMGNTAESKRIDSTVQRIVEDSLSPLSKEYQKADIDTVRLWAHIPFEMDWPIDSDIAQSCFTAVRKKTPELVEKITETTPRGYRDREWIITAPLRTMEKEITFRKRQQ